MRSWKSTNTPAANGAKPTGLLQPEEEGIDTDYVGEGRTAMHSD